MKKILISILILFLVYQILGLIPPIQKVENKIFLNENHLRIAHRCGKNNYPENTLVAASKVQEHNLADFLELDVRLTKDSRLVVIHDETLDRTTNGKGKVANLTYEEIQQLDAGYNFTIDDGKTYPYRDKDVKISLLEEFFQKVPDIQYYIEIKVPDNIAADILLENIKKYNMSEKVIIGSSFHNIKKYLIKLEPNLTYYASKNDAITWIILYKLNLNGFYKPKFNAITLPPKLGFISIDSKFIETAHSQNIKVHLWTINNSSEMVEYINSKVDGIITDDILLLNRTIIEKTK